MLGKKRKQPPGPSTGNSRSYSIPWNPDISIDSWAQAGSGDKRNPPGYHSNTLITVVRVFQVFAVVLVAILYPTSKPSDGGLYYFIAPAIAGVTGIIAIALLLYRHVWNYVVVGAESVAFLAWIVLLGMSSSYPLEKDQGMAAFAVGSGFVLWAETAFVVVITPLTYRLYNGISKKYKSRKAAQQHNRAIGGHKLERMPGQIPGVGFVNRPLQSRTGEDNVWRDSVPAPDRTHQGVMEV